MQTAMRDSDDVPVFVDEYGEYTTTFPRENIVRFDEDAEKTVFIVYGFVGEQGDFEEGVWDFDDEDTAVEFASEIYGLNTTEIPVLDEFDVENRFSRVGEVFEVEIHELPVE